MFVESLLYSCRRFYRNWATARHDPTTAAASPSRKPVILQPNELSIHSGIYHRFVLCSQVMEVFIFKIVIK
jgi:hypothetical protein